ncbi:MAG: YggS family pyridoxal phosphate-dependent enzyme [Deltaproteobacteria bacterium]|nr:YggS family pyridoxal phosphate-dependent enzyme [Deltaproteobacteria bacterium]
MLTPDSVAQRVAAVEERLDLALGRCGRTRDEVTLVAVSKAQPAEALAAAAGAGIAVFGENYAQEMAAKRMALETLLEEAGRQGPAQVAIPGRPAAEARTAVPFQALRFHFIGPLQTNKVKLVVGKCPLLHTVDRLRLAEALSARALALGVVQDILFEVHLSPEPTKSGAAPDELPALVERTLRLPSLRPLGLMTMPPWSDDPEESRGYFSRLRELAGSLSSRLSLPDFRQLSMGMSHDFEVAVEEGATLIRVGTAIFGGRGTHLPLERADLTM